MVELVGSHDLAPEVQADGLVAEAHAEQRNALIRCHANDLHEVPRSGGLARPRGQQDGVELSKHIGEGGIVETCLAPELGCVIAPHHAVLLVVAELPEVLDEVINETVEVIDDQDAHGCDSIAAVSYLCRCAPCGAELSGVAANIGRCIGSCLSSWKHCPLMEANYA